MVVVLDITIIRSRLVHLRSTNRLTFLVFINYSFIILELSYEEKLNGHTLTITAGVINCRAEHRCSPLF